MLPRQASSDDTLLSAPSRTSRPARHHHKDLSFEPPGGWIDASIARFHPPPSPPGAPPVPSITMWREPLSPGETLELYVARLILRLGRTTESFELLENENTVLGERPASLLRFRCHPGPEAGSMEQTMALIRAGNERERFVAVFSFACPAEGAESNRAVFSDVLRSVRVDAEDVSAAPSDSARFPELAPASSAMRSFARDVEMNVALPPMPGVRAR